MSDSIITVENLSKKYVISHKEAGNYTALRDVLVNGAKNLFGKGKPQNYKEDFWALRDINFEIKQGDRVGIIGRNGAGKSTLLKILSRITEPTTGRIHLKGRVASLLEVGTGFHPELTGRENIFLNGAIMGMSKWEIKKKFDEIVEFAEVEKFLDTPVKRYSSGMYVRLAFAVAAHLEPEILVVDEVLAVGDAQFQKKCLGKMEDVGKEGRTVLFVSHNMGAIKQLCTRGLLLNNGELQLESSLDEIIYQYNSNITQVTQEGDYINDGSGLIKLKSYTYKPNIMKIDAREILNIKFNFSLIFEQEILNNEISFAIGISNYDGARVAHMENDLIKKRFNASKGSMHLAITIKNSSLKEGVYRLTLFAKCKNEIALWIKDQVAFEVPSRDFWGTGQTLEGKSATMYLDYNMELNNAG